MVSVASRGTTERIAVRIWRNARRAGSGTRARYSFTVVGAVRLGAERMSDFRFMTADSIACERTIAPGVSMAAITMRKELGVAPRTRDLWHPERRGRPVH